MSQNVKLTTTTSVKKLIDAVIREGVKSALAQKALDEKEKQVASGGTQQPSDGGDGGNLFGDSEGGTEGGEGEQDGGNETSKTGDDEQEKLKSGDVEPKDIVEKLNSIRSGKSFKDDSVKGSMNQYIESLSSAERVALLSFLKGIAQIVTGEIPAQQAEEPAKHPSDIQMTKGAEHKTKHIKPNIIKGQAPKKQQGSSTEDTSAPASAPITAKKR